MKNSSSKTILEKAYQWIKDNQEVVVITVVKTWGSSPQPIGSKMIVNENRDFIGSVSGGCIESFIIEESLEIIKKNQSFKLINFKVSNKYLTKFLMEKASISINGVSLTISKVIKNSFEINVIPHTLKLTNLQNLKSKSLVNVELDIFS